MLLTLIERSDSTSRLGEPQAASFVAWRVNRACTLVFVEDDTDDQGKTMPEKTITASCNLYGHDLTDVPVLNPGGWWGKCWLVEVGGSYTPLFLIVEADTVSDAIDELSDNKTFGHQIHVGEEDLGDYPEDERHFDGSGRVIDLEHVMVHGQERSDLPFPVRYHGDELPEGGIDPRKFGESMEE